MVMNIADEYCWKLSTYFILLNISLKYRNLQTDLIYFGNSSILMKVRIDFTFCHTSEQQHMFLSRYCDITYKINLKPINDFLTGTSTFVRLSRKRSCESYSLIGHPALKNPYKHHF